jgi:O-antigen/teichoic acid export membrane protein
MKKNIIANFIGRIWTILSNFLFVPLYIHYLGFESYSIISFTLIIAGLMAFLDAGLTATLSREFARVDNSHEEKIRTFKTLESSYFIIVGISIVLVFALSRVIANKWLNLNTFNPNRISFFLKIISFDIGFQLLFRFYMGGMLGLEKQVRANMYQIGWGALRNGLVVVAILFVPKLEMFFLWQALSTVCFTLLLKLSLSNALTGQNKFDFRPKIERSVFSRIWQFAGGMLLISLVASLNTQMDKLAISKLLPVENLGYYTLAVSLSMGIVVLVNPISTALLPRFTALFSAQENAEALKLFKKVNLFVAILVFSVMAILTFFAKDLIWIWTGKMDLADHSYFYLPIIAMSYAMLSLAYVPYSIAIANGYTKLNNLLGIISLFITLPGYWIVTKHFGAIGAAYVFCGVQTAITLIYIFIINKKYLDKNEIGTIYLKQILLPMLISLGIAFGFSHIPYLLTNSRLYSFVFIGISTIITFTVTLVILVPVRDIKRIVDFKSLLGNPI